MNKMIFAEKGRILSLWVCVSAACMIAATTIAGYGEYLQDQTVTCRDGQDRTLDLIDITIFLDQNPKWNPADLSSWSNWVATASQRIWDYTEKQVALNEVVIYRRTKPRGVDVVSREEEWPRATSYRPVGFLPAKGLDGFGQIFLPANMTIMTDTWGNPRDAGGIIAHEFGHYAFGLGDDYKVYTQRDSDGQYLTASRDADGDITSVAWSGSKTYSGGMSFFELRSWVSPTGDGTAAMNAFRASPSTIMYRELSSLEVSTQGTHYLPWAGTVKHGGSVHDVTFTIDQHDKHGQSAWETLRDDRGLTIPATVVDNTADYATEMPPIQWILTELHPSVMIALDRSGSMGGVMQLAITGAGTAVENAATRQKPIFGFGQDFPGDNVGIASYSSTVNVDAELEEMVDKAKKIDHKSKIAGLSADGNTAIGEALATCLDRLEKKNGNVSSPGEKEIIFLLSDGMNNSGQSPEGTVLTQLENRGVTIHTIALGSSADVALMRRVADATGGKTTSVDNADELDEFFSKIYTDARDSSVMNAQSDVISSAPVEHQIVVDPYSDMDLTFNLFWETGDLDLNIVKPDGTVIDHTIALSDPDIELIESDRSEFMRFVAPTSGVWTVRVIPISQTGSQNYSVQTASTGKNNVRMHMEASGSSLTHPEPLVIAAHFSGPFQGVKGVDVSGNVLRPDGSSVPFTLYDDGDPAHGDEYAADGLYANIFTSLNEDGEYRFVMDGDNVDGMTCMPGYGIPDGFDIPPSEPVAPFTREQTITVQYDGIPEFINATEYTETDFATWELDRSSGAMVGRLVVSNRTDSVKTLIEPFWYAVTDTHNVKLADPDGITDKGDPYVDVTDKVNAALETKYGRQNMEPGEWVEIDGIAIYSRDRSVPDMTAVWSLWADPPGAAERRIDNFDVNADGDLNDSEILLAVEHWAANDMPDFDLLRRIELWKNGPNPFSVD